MCKIKYCVIALILNALLSSQKLFADCIWGGSFLKNIESANLIVRGKILVYHEGTTLSSSLTSLEVEVLEIYKGESEYPKIKIIDDALFGANLLGFPVGTEWILALGGSDGKYRIPGCWTSYLTVESSTVVGNLNNNVVGNVIQQVSLEEFKTLLQNPKAVPPLCNSANQPCSWPTAWYDDRTGQLYIPAVSVFDASGKISIYSVTLKQNTTSFIFELNSVRSHDE